ncbi:GNAT family N-acetyltransferase [Parachitinimonas caeni]|uniref:GNAT family N-acetyltransferase n=1 Tax=Parachitinimonas caeni TaxID=3031301 RepID=A0ABT7E0D4_9NEIS|nr:GNAT family N-acetyltransferase [Parachitinimonas caeni]MDK2125767.1 GNAT family N-acetyltransferase [Parachitinimonas caeni]
MQQPDLPPEYLMRPVHPADVERIGLQRYRMFTEAGWPDDERMQAMNTAFIPWLESALARGEYFGWMIEHQGEPVAGLGMFWLSWPPHPLDAGTRRGYLLNIYTEPAHRGKGLASALVRQGLATSRAAGVTVTALHATKIGRPLYESLGFSGSSEMFWIEPA